MNIVIYSIEASISGKKHQAPITDLMKDNFKENLHYTGKYENVLQDTWKDLPFDMIKTLYSPKYLIGTFVTKSKIQIFLFRSDVNGIKPKNSCSIDVLAIGDLGINNIVNNSFTEITKIIGKIKCNFINDSKIFLLPYDVKQKDIWSPDLKIKADYNPINKYRKDDFIRIGVVTILTIIFLIFYLLNLTTHTDDTNNNPEIIFRSLFISGLFYIILDSIVKLLIPSIFYYKKKDITIKDLSNFFEFTEDNPFNESKTKKKLTTPSIPE